MKRLIYMILYLFGIVIANILVFVYSVDSIAVITTVIGCAAYYKAIISEKFSDIYNIHSFKLTITFNNVLELIGSFLVCLIMLKSDVAEHNYNFITVSFFIITGLLIYRFLFFNLSKGTSGEEN